MPSACNWHLLTSWGGSQLSCSWLEESLLLGPAPNLCLSCTSDPQRSIRATRPATCLRLQELLRFLPSDLFRTCLARVLMVLFDILVRGLTSWLGGGRAGGSI